jgi:rRNA maturation endonuclease Nob1
MEKNVERIPHADRWGDRCGDCGAAVGEYHRDGCDLEICPICGGQFLTCDCDAGGIVANGGTL